MSGAMNPLLAQGAQLLSQQLGLKVDVATVTQALSQLLSGSKGGTPDLAQLAGKLMAGGGATQLLGGLMGKAGGSGLNINPDQLRSALGADRLSAFSSQIGVAEPQATASLASVLPSLLSASTQGKGMVGALTGLLGR